MAGFIGEADVRFLSDGRNVRLLSTFSYVDKRGRIWKAKEGAVVNGASIPRLFWRLIGSPWVGKYRRASIIHDVYCHSKTRPSKTVHKVWCEMVAADGTPDWKTWAVCKAVRWFGPKWKGGDDESRFLSI